MSGKKKSNSLHKSGASGKSLSTGADIIEKFLGSHPHSWLWLSGLLPVAGLLIVYISIGIYPFGEKSVANVDMMQQYIPFYASLKNAVFGGHGLEYSSSLGLGGSYWGLIGYYLTSPFSWLSLLVPDECLVDYMAFQELLRVGLTGCSFACFFSRKFNRKDLFVPLFSACYAMSAFMLVHLCTVIWGGCLMLLPLIVLGLEELLRGRKPWLYILCLSAAGISNYYFAMMIGIYLVLYTAVFLINEGLLSDLKEVIRKTGMFAASSLLSVGIGAGILLPSLLLVGESGNASYEAASAFWAMNPLRLFRQYIFNADYHILSDDSLPLLYCSLLVVILIPLFFVCREIPTRIKISFGVLSGFLMLSLTVNGLNYLWHGAHIPNDLPYRFAFLLVFTLLIMAGYVVEKLDYVRAITIDIVLCGLMAVAVIDFFTIGTGRTASLIGTFLFSIGYTLLLVLRAENKIPKTAAMLAVLALAAVELTSGGVMAWKALNTESEYVGREKIISHIQHMNDLTEKISTVSGSDLFRLGAITEVSENNNALIGVGGLSFFSSTNNGALMRLLDREGYNSSGRVDYYYKSFTPLMDSVYNVKYVFYNTDVGNPPYLEPVGSSGGYYAYRNTLALPRAFAVSDSIKEWDTDHSDPFEVQNDFARRAVSDSDLTVYEPLTLTPDKSRSYGGGYRDGKVTIRVKGKLTLRAESDERKHLYICVDCPDAQTILISVGERQYAISDRDNFITDLGWFEQGETFTVTVGGEEPVSGYVHAAVLNEKALESCISHMSLKPGEFREYTETHIVCDTKTCKGEILFTSIPYEKGWKATVNGKPVDIFPVGGGLIGIPLADGVNTVELNYSVRGMTAGIIISLLSIVSAVWLLFGKEKCLIARK